MSYRDEFNGKSKVQTGRVIMSGIKTQKEVDTLLRNFRIDFPDMNYEQSGVSGSYVIIERDGSSQHSDYV
jgi:hypothetical protein